ncbi:MAG TPA: hypothetical protein PLK41_05315, partial [Defluviitoga tunisiensis]|nr:hypothetical protein [Defluviitoga tunisiensis]
KLYPICAMKNPPTKLEIIVPKVLINGSIEDTATEIENRSWIDVMRGARVFITIEKITIVK